MTTTKPAAHTPTPWAVADKQDLDGSRYIEAADTEATNLHVACVFGHGDQRKAGDIAALIVSRVNGWDALTAERDSALDRCDLALKQRDENAARIVALEDEQPDCESCRAYEVEAGRMQARIAELEEFIRRWQQIIDGSKAESWAREFDTEANAALKVQP